jgi:hypothetical protein
MAIAGRSSKDKVMSRMRRSALVDAPIVQSSNTCIYIRFEKKEIDGKPVLVGSMDPNYYNSGPGEVKKEYTDMEAFKKLVSDEVDACISSVGK